LILFRIRETLLDHLDVTATEICADVRDERVWGFDIPRYCKPPAENNASIRSRIETLMGGGRLEEG
jgi:hypothetical protein